MLKQQANDGSLWVTRYKGGTILLDEQGERLDLVALLAQATSSRVDLGIRLGGQHQIPCRLVAERVPADKLRQRQQQLRRWESRKQQQASATRHALLAWSVYLTNATPQQLSADDVMLMARARWQIELLFRLWKDTVDIDDWRTQYPWRILCEVYAKLIACIVQHWLLLVSGLHALERSFVQARPVIQHWAWALAYTLTDPGRLRRLIDHIGCILSGGCRISSSASSPPTFQRIRACSSLT